MTDGSEDQSAVSADNERLDRNREQFERLLDRACRYAERGRHDLAAAWAEIAADQAYCNHPGFFADERLEQLLARIGLAMTTPVLSWRAGGSDWPRSVLHIPMIDTPGLCCESLLTRAACFVAAFTSTLLIEHCYATKRPALVCTLAVNAGTPRSVGGDRYGQRTEDHGGSRSATIGATAIALCASRGKLGGQSRDGAPRS